MKQLVLTVPDKVFDALERAEKELRTRKEDLVTRAIVKVLEEAGMI